VAWEVRRAETDLKDDPQRMMTVKDGLRAMCEEFVSSMASRKDKRLNTYMIPHAERHCNRAMAPRRTLGSEKEG
jgi:hypothetical protein